MKYEGNGSWSQVHGGLIPDTIPGTICPDTLLLRASLYLLAKWENNSYLLWGGERTNELSHMVKLVLQFPALLIFPYKKLMNYTGMPFHIAHF